MVRVAAVQLEAVLADVDANLAACERLGVRAGEAGAEVIALPEFFTTGIGFDERLARAALPPDGVATELLCSLAARFGALVGGSFLCRDGDGQVRNAYLLAGPDGVLGRHDKDLPTMWENAFYVGGSDPGVLDAGRYRVGAAVCWELMRTQTVHRLKGQVDLLLTGSGWWSVPEWAPAPLFRRLERANTATARTAAVTFAQFIGAPCVHAAHAGTLDCDMPWLPLRYRGRFEGSSVITEADGTVLAELGRDDGEGVILAEVTPGRRTPVASTPRGFWLHSRGAPATAFWHYQRWHGTRWYQKHTAGQLVNR
ncbi:carbon-nitrogen hydrolase family protein [Pseudonocardia spinosispora]|uniref:carbon-nitrogen hydrolase family protein n=1 Tax=Pseudonocardia spinosispora TaxID=103441 RepID=UPI0004901ACC|nr:carbon-nitrogen hydrolase family protein [Pseudonocardia spinosispora]